MYPDKLGAYITKERMKINPSRRDFAEKNGLDPSTLGHIENGDTKSPGLQAIIDIAKALKINELKLISVYKGEDPSKEAECIDTGKIEAGLMMILSALPLQAKKEIAEVWIQQEGEEEMRDILKEALEIAQIRKGE